MKNFGLKSFNSEKLKRISSTVIALLLIFTLMPLEVLANLQAPVVDLSLTLSDSSPTASGSTGYTINANWAKPPMSSRPDNAAVIGDRTALHDIEGYNVYYRNATISQQYLNPQGEVKPPSGATSENLQFSNLQLNHGSIYKFRVTPYHNHTYEVADGFEIRNAPMDNNYSAAEAIYLTDIEVSGIGSGNKMTVTWDNPTVDGSDIFTAYRISYVPKSALVTDQPIPDSPSRTAAMSEVKRLPNGKLEFIIEDDSLEIGEDYCIKVEPMYEGQLFRNLQQITYKNSNYKVAYTSRQYFTDKAYVKPSLYVEPMGMDYLNIYWDPIKIKEEVDRVEIYMSDNGDSQEAFEAKQKLIGTIGGSYNVNYFLLEDYPRDRITYYQLLIWVKGSPEPKKSEIREFDPTYNDFRPYSPTILATADNGSSPYTITLDWEAFIRDPYNDEERIHVDADGKYVDKNIIYDIWVTDDSANFNDPAYYLLPTASQHANSLVTKEIGQGDDKKLAYEYGVSKFYTRDEFGAYHEESFVENKIYYIRIRARRDTNEGQTSQEATGQHFLKPLGPVSPIPNMMSKPPLRIMLDDEGVKMITQESITVQWDLRWFEVYSADDKRWYAVGVDGSGKIVTTDFPENITPYGQNLLDTLPDYASQEEKQVLIDSVKPIFAAAGLTGDVRVMDLTGAKYQIHVVQDDYVQKNGGYEGYLNSINIPGFSDWHDITPEGTAKHPHYVVTSEHKPTAGKIQPNTAYVIFFRPYTEIAGVFYAWFPNYVTATTMEARVPVDITPTVPILEPVSESDMELVVRWEYSESLKYELRYSDVLSDYSEGGTTIPWEQIKEEGEFATASDGKRYITYKITGLFPETPYYVWVRAIAPNSTGDLPSAWSNPIYMTTTDIIAPDPPKGLGLASKDHISEYNKGNNTNYVPVDSDYMIIEWTRDFLDTAPPGQGGGGDGNVQELPVPSLLSSYMVRFGDLVANRPYYIRAKTILTVTKQGNEVVKTYNYVVELADNPDFLDARSITVPAVTGPTDPIYTRVKESAWSKTVSFVTNPSTGEYDSDKNDNMYPLPTQDYEITYDPTTETLTYRFRTNQQDSSGAADNGVDQRFITKLVQNKTYTYNLDLTSYDNKVITNRTVQLPYSIYKAFEERKINFKLTADNIALTIPPGAVNTKEIANLKDFGKDANVIVTVAKNAVNTPTLSTADSYVSAPQKLTVQVVTPSRTIPINLLAKKISVDLKLDHRYDTLDKNIGSYMSDANTVGWERVNSDYDSLQGIMRFATDKVMNYSALARNLPIIASADEDSTNAFYNVATRLDISDMGMFNPNDGVTAVQFNNIVSAVAKGKLTVAVNNELSAAELQSLTKSKLAATGGTVSREVGISALVRLYELKTKSAVKGFPALDETGYADIGSAQQAYQTPLLKADYLGFLGDTGSASPKAALTMGEMLKIVDIIISDAGL